MKTIAIRTIRNGSPLYVEELKGKVGDWGYTSNAASAIHLSPYWQRRFAADCRYCGADFVFVEVA